MDRENQLMMKIQKSFFLLEPLDSLLVDLICTNKDFNQEKLLLCTIHHAIMKKYPNKLDYTVRYLKQLISLLEYNSIEVLETIYNEYVTFLGVKSEIKEYYYRHFAVNEKICVIKNTYSMISRGTTGLCVWEGAMVLAEWCLQNKTLLENKNIFELGCGVGMAGLVAIQNCNIDSYNFSDCNDDVLEILRHNIQINIDESSENSCNSKDIKAEPSEVLTMVADTINKVSEINIKSHNKIGTSVGIIDPNELALNPTKNECLNNGLSAFKKPSISINKLTFEEISVLKENDIICDVVLASDVVYDSDLFPSLKNALVNIFNLNKNCSATFACKVRNMDTFESFVNILRKTELFQVHEDQLNPQNLLFFSDQKMYSMVKILLIKRNNT